MYGYVRPARGELKVREYETYRGVYCGLCHTLRARYGPPLRWTVNYDLCFLAMLLAGTDTPETRARRCPYHPLRRTVCPSFSALEAAADDSVILAWWKLKDSVRDGGFFPSLAAGTGSALLRGAYRAAAARRPVMAETAARQLARLTALEERRCASLDDAAEPFAEILAAAGAGDDPVRSRVLRELLYHLGQIVYILDAVDDLAEDGRSGAYNPLLYRFELQDGRLCPEDERYLRGLLTHAHNRMSSAFALLDPNPYHEILTNIIYLGLPAVTQAVFTGQWRKRERRQV